MKLEVGIKVLLQDQAGRYLFVRRNPEKYPGVRAKWDIPGGRIEASETLIEALGREVREETGLELAYEPVLIAAQDIMLENKSAHIVRLTYHSTATGTVTLSDEHTTYAWMSPCQALSENVDPYVGSLLKKDC